MADQKQPFRFRLPWLAPERPAVQPQRRRSTTDSPQLPWRPTAAVPSQQSVPSQPPRQQSRLPRKAESQLPSPSSSPLATQNPKTSTSSTSQSQAATESIKSPSKPTSSPISDTTTKPPFPSPSSVSSSLSKVPSPSRVAIESVKSPPPSSSKQPIVVAESSKSTTPKQPPTTLVVSKVASPSRVSNESRKTVYESASLQSSPSHAPNESLKATSKSIFVQSSPSIAATESLKTPSSPASALPSPSRAAKESPKATSKSSSTQPSSSRASDESLNATSSSASAQPSPSHATIEPRPSSQARTQSKTIMVASSPSKGDSKSKTSSSLPSPSRSTSKGQPEVRKTSQPQSLSEGSPRKATKKEPEAMEQQKKEKPPEPESKVKLTFVTKKSPTLQDDAIKRERTDVSSLEKRMPSPKGLAEETAEPEKQDSSTGRDNQKLMSSDLKENGGTKEIIQKFSKEEKNKEATHEKPEQKIIIEMPSSKKDGKETHIGEFQATKKQQWPEASTRKETFPTPSYIGKQIKTVEGNTSMSFQNPIREAAPRQREIKEDLSKLVWKLATGSQLDENQVTVITLTGENRGASMLLSSEQLKKEASIHIHRGYKTDPDNSPESITDGEMQIDRRKLDQKAQQPKAYLNSNAQSVNNSIVVEASLAERNPGVHMFVSQNTSKSIKGNGASEFIQTRSKSESRLSTSERLTHEPNVRRRCLRGLFLESSDSDMENPHKPRRHGCRYSCEQKNKDREFM